MLNYIYHFGNVLTLYYFVITIEMPEKNKKRIEWMGKYGSLTS